MIVLYRVLVVMYVLLLAFTFIKNRNYKKGLKMWSQDMFKGVRYLIALIVIVSVLIGYGIGKII